MKGKDLKKEENLSLSKTSGSELRSTPATLGRPYPFTILAVIANMMTMDAVQMLILIEVECTIVSFHSKDLTAETDDAEESRNLKFKKDLIPLSFFTLST